MSKPSDAAGETEPQTVSDALERAVAHHGAGRLAKADAIYRRILKADPNQPSALHLLGVIALQTGNDERAVDLISRSLAQKPDYAEAHNNLGNALKNLDRLDDAVASYRAAIAIKPGDAMAHYNLANVLQDTEQLDDAVESYRTAVTLEPNYAEAHNNLANALKSLGKSDEAVACYRRAVAIQPEFGEAHGNLAVALHDAKDLPGAIEHYRAALATNPDDADAHGGLGSALADAGHLPDAIDSFRASLTLKPDVAETHNSLGTALRLAERPDEAIDCFRQAIALKPDLADAVYNLGRAFKDLGRTDEAIAQYKEAISLRPAFAPAHYNLGNALKDKHKLDDAVASYRAAIGIVPDLAEAHNNLGNALNELGRLDEAIESYRTAFAVQPDHVEARYNLGTLYEKTSKLDDAALYFREALTVDPEFAQARISLAVVMRRRGEIGDAIEALAQLPFADLNANDAARAHFELGKLYDTQNDSTQAIAHFTEGNSRLAQSMPSDVSPARAFDSLAAAERLLEPAVMREWFGKPGRPVDDPPVFLIGFPRSGTTLLDQILDSHPGLQVVEEKPVLNDVQAVLCADESDVRAALRALSDADLDRLRDHYWSVIQRHIDKRQETRLVDKFPLNIIHVPLIARLFPNASIILALRHPCDVVLSNFMQRYRLNDAMANFFTIADAARYYSRMMGFWLRCAEQLPLHFHTIRYEDLVGNLEGEIRRLLQFLALEWDDATMNYAAHARQRGRIHTPSYQQVTQPIYRGARYRWRRYEKYLNPVLGDLQPFLEAFGYADLDASLKA